MAIRFMEGFENRKHEDYIDRITAGFSGNESFGVGRRLGSSLQGQNFGVPTKALVSSVENTWIACWAMRKQEGTLDGSSDAGIKFSDSGGVQCELVMVNAPESTDAFKWELKRGASVIATSSPFAHGDGPQSWHYFVLKVTVRTGVNGAYELRHFDMDNNSTVVFSGSGENLANQGTDGADRITYSLFSNNQALISIDDIVIMDSTGSKNNDIPSEPFVITGALPDGDGNRNEWDGSSGGPKYALIDDPVGGPPEDNNHIQTDVTPEDELFTYASFTGQIDSGTAVVAVQVNTTATMETSGSRTCRPIIREGAGEATGANFIPDMMHITYFEIFEDNPVDSVAWSQSDIEGMEVGVEAVS